MDKVYREGTLKAAWQKVAANGGAAGVDEASSGLRHGRRCILRS